MKQAVIVGAGAAGLAAAILLGARHASPKLRGEGRILFTLHLSEKSRNPLIKIGNL